MSDAPLRARVLVKDGRWTVPPEQRPRNWRSILDEPRSALKITVVETALDIRRCACGQPAGHRKCCFVRAFQVKEARELRRRRITEGFAEIRAGIENSGAEWGCDPPLVEAGLVLLLGMWTQHPQLIGEIIRCPRSRAELLVQRCRAMQFWGPHWVELGDIDGPHGDLEFWIRAMAVNGDIDSRIIKGIRMFGPPGSGPARKS